MKEDGEKDWANFTTRVKQCFSRKHSALVISCIWDNLKQTGSVKEYIKEHKRILNLADASMQVNNRMDIYIFLRNLKNYVHHAIWDKDCTTLEVAYHEARSGKQKCHSMS